MAIAKFSNSNAEHTPIILSLENHCNAKQQRQMAAILGKHFDRKMLIVRESSKEYPRLD